MTIQANNIIDANTIGKRRQQKKATVHSLARIESPPDVQPLASALQTTLELDELIRIFLSEAGEYIPADGISYRHSEGRVLIQQGLQARHSASYGLSLQDESLGELTITRSRPFAEQDLAVLEHLLCALLYPIRNALRYRTALAGAFIDPLTGINNRSALDRALVREVELAHRNNLPLSLLILDLDLFKLVNDTHGHLAGDCVLRGSAARLESMLRTSDQVFRFGGEEFVMILTGTDREAALLVAERLRAGIAEAPYECEGVKIPVTTSIGLTQLDVHDDVNNLFDRADKALYQAKANGRNRVVG